MWSETTSNSSSIICIYRVFYLVCKSINYAQMLNCKTCQKLLTSTPPHSFPELSKLGSCVFCALLDRYIGQHIDRHSTNASVNISTTLNRMSVNIQGSKKNLSGRPGQVNFPFGPVTFSPSLPDGQVSRQGVRRFNFC